AEGHPAARLGLEAAPARHRELVEARPPVVLGRAPDSPHGALFLEALQRGIERPVLDEDPIARSGLYGAGDALAVGAAGGERAEDEEVEGALEQGLAALGRHAT